MFIILLLAPVWLGLGFFDYNTMLGDIVDYDLIKVLF